MEIIDVAQREFREPNTKVIWLLVVVLGHGIGSIVYYFAGKPQGWLPGEMPLTPNYPNYSQTGPPPPGQWPPPPGSQ
ncbi:MAG: PLD nuclease N-terminal domain-containing protein [Janthinobacterium lividum]